MGTVPAGFEKLERISGFQGQNRGSFSINYDANSRLATLAYAGAGTGSSGATAPTSLTGTYTYDHSGRLLDLTWKGAGGPFSGYGYGGGSGSGSGSGSGGGSGSSSNSGFFDEFTWSYDNDTRDVYFSNPFYSSENRSFNYDRDWQLTRAEKRAEKRVRTI
jgi:hypothetical protein